MQKKSTRKFNWSASAAFGDGRYSGAAKANNKKSPGKKKNNDAGVLGRARLVVTRKGD